MSLKQRLMAMGLVAGVALAGSQLVAPHEGKVLGTYIDPVGILTACYGHTSKALKESQFFTEQQCLELLATDLINFDRQLLRLTHPIMLTEGEHAAYLSFIYNIGAESFRTSTLRRKLRGDDRVGACNELLKWVYAKGTKLPGLIKRRTHEQQICLKDLYVDQNH